MGRALVLAWRFWRVVACPRAVGVCARPLKSSARGKIPLVRAVRGFRGIIARVRGFPRVLGLFSGLLAGLRLRGASSEPIEIAHRLKPSARSLPGLAFRLGSRLARPSASHPLRGTHPYFLRACERGALPPPSESKN